MIDVGYQTLLVAAGRYAVWSVSAVKSVVQSDTSSRLAVSTLTTSAITSALLVAKCITRLCADVVQCQRVRATSAFATPSVDSCICE